MMVPFSGHSLHTLKMPHKPIKEGFKLWALCDKGYLWDFMFYSQKNGNIPSYINLSLNLQDLGTISLEKHPELSPTHSAVLQLMKTLPFKEYEFTLFCDNLFSNPQLFGILRSLGIGACGTA